MREYFYKKLKRGLTETAISLAPKLIIEVNIMMIDLEKFFQEKEIPYIQWEIEHEGTTHIIDSETVIENILSTQGKERIQIGGTLFRLDFANASITDYLKFLAECMIKQSGKH